jgi:hypothetical protein
MWILSMWYQKLKFSYVVVFMDERNFETSTEMLSWETRTNPLTWEVMILAANHFLK